MTQFCKTKVPQHMADTLETIKDSDEAIKAYGVSVGTMMCERLLSAGVPGLHMYTLNLDKTAVAILRHVKLLPPVETVPAVVVVEEVPAAVAEKVLVANGV
jgi:methylenetetrahydrofolate reductase (NADPH)